MTKPLLPLVYMPWTRAPPPVVQLAVGRHRPDVDAPEGGAVLVGLRSDVEVRAGAVVRARRRLVVVVVEVRVREDQRCGYARRGEGEPVGVRGVVRRDVDRTRL